MANLSFLAMIEGQLKAGRKIDGTIVAISGKAEPFEVADFKMGKEGNLEEVTVLNKEGLDITICAANQDIAHYRRNPNGKAALPADKIAVVDGKIQWETADGIAFDADLGDYEIERVLGSFMGTIFFLLKNDDAADLNAQVLAYDVQSDKFLGIIGTIGVDAQMVVLSDTEGYVINNLIRPTKVDETKDGQPVMVDCVKVAEVLGIGNGGFYNLDDFDDDDCSIIDAIAKSVDGKATLFFAKTYFDDVNGEVKDLQKMLVGIKYGDVEDSVLVDTFNTAEVQVFVGGANDDIITVKTPTQMIIDSIYSGTIVDSKSATVVKALDGFNIFCGQSKVFDVDGSTSTKFTYANDQYATKSFVVKNTDRGQVVTIC